MQKFFYCILTFILLLPALAFAQNTASWQIWSDIDGNLTKQSDFTTDSVIVVRNGKVVTVTMEARVNFGDKTTRRLEFVIGDFEGVGRYTPVNGTGSFWENFTLDKKCKCQDHISNDVTITKFDSTKNELSGTFTFKCNSTSTTGGLELFSRIREGKFSFFGSGKIKLEITPKDTLSIGELQADTTFNIQIKALNGTTPLGGATIFVNNKIETPTEFFDQKNTTGEDGTTTYEVKIKKDTPPGDYLIRLYGDKSPFTARDTAFVMIRYGKRFFDFKCGGLSVLRFDAGEGKEWKPVATGSPIVKSDGPVKIGGVIVVNGAVRINTTAGAERVFIDGGKVVIPDIGNDGNGGKEDLDLSNYFPDVFPLPDCSGIIQLAIDSTKGPGGAKKLSKKLPGGTTIELTKFGFIERSDAKGISIEGKISLMNSRAGCDPALDTTGGFTVTEPSNQSLTIGADITTGAPYGFEKLAVKAEAISLTSALCIKEIAVNADFLNKIYLLGGKIEFPVKKNKLALGGAVQFRTNPANPTDKMALDSINLSATLADPFRIGTTPLGFKSLTLATGGLSLPTFDGSTYKATVLVQSLEQIIMNEFPKLQSAFGKLALIEIEGSCEYKHPAIITGTITTRALKLPKISTTKPWQAEGVNSVRFDYNSSLVASGSIKLGHLGGPDYLLNGSGSLTAQWFPTTGISGTITGQVGLPSPGPDILKLQYIGSILRFMRLSGLIPQQLGTGTATVGLNDNTGFTISASADVSQNPVDLIRDFGRLNILFNVKDTVSFSLIHDTVPVNRGGIIGKTIPEVQDAAQATNQIVVDEDVERVFIVVSGATNAPASHLVDPSGTRIDTTSASGAVKKYSTPGGEMTMWTLINPIVGIWQVNIPEVRATDEIEITANRKVKAFAITAEQVDSNVTVRWQPVGNTDNDIVQVFVDSDSIGADGIFLGQASATSGLFQGVLSADFKGCSYKIYATRIAGSQPITNSYASAVIAGRTVVPSPLEVTAVSTESGKTTISWRMPAGTAVQAFQIFVKNADGSDTLIASAFTEDRFVVVQIDDHTSKRIAIVAINADGDLSCKTEAVGIVTSVEDNQVQFAANSQNILVVPNPTNNFTTIRFISENATTADVEIVNTVGQLVMSTTNIQLAGGWNTVEWNASGMVPGTYFVRIKTDVGYSSGIISVSK